MGLIWLVTTIYFIATPFTGAMYFFYTVAIILEDQREVKRVMWVASTPFLIYLGIVLTNPLTKQLFNLNGLIGYSRGPWISSTYVVFYVYCLLCLVAVFWKRKELDPSIGRILIAFPLIAVVVIFAQQILVKYILTGTAVAWPC